MAAYGTGPNALGVIILALSTGIAGGMIMDILFIRKVNITVVRLEEKSGEFGMVVISVLYSAVLVVFVAPILGARTVYLLTF